MLCEECATLSHPSSKSYEAAKNQEVDIFLVSECLTVLRDIKGISSEDFVFECSCVTYQLKEDEVNKCLNSSRHLCREVYKTIKARGKVGSSRFEKKRKRWLNDEIVCQYCGKLYGTNEKNHLEVFCSGMYGEGLTAENSAYPFSRLKRFRHLTRKTP